MSAPGFLFVFVSGALIGAAVAYAACHWRSRLERHFAQEPARLSLVSRTVRLLPPVRDWEKEGWA